MMSLLEGITLAHHYQLQQRLAHGGMSEVYLAIDTRTTQEVAVKLVQRDHTEICERFRREMKAIAGLEHDHILPAFDYGEYGPWCYMVMPYIEHGTLRNRLSQGPLSPKEAGAILEQLARALQFAHEHGIIHRDIKPSNILLRDGLHVYLADFGLVKHLDVDSSITQTGVLIGTPEYMAPELIDQPASISSDLYALGIVLYQMLTGRVPFKSTTPMGIYWKHLQELPPPPSTINPAIEPAIEQVLLRALEKDPGQRFRSARELAQAYRNAINAHPVTIVHPYNNRDERAGDRVVTTPFAAAVAMSTIRKALATPKALTTPMIPKAASKRRIVALGTCVLLCLFVLPAWLGFSFYSAYHRTQLSTHLTMLQLGNDYPVLPIVPTKPNTPPLPPIVTPTPTPANTGGSIDSHSAPSTTRVTPLYSGDGGDSDDGDGGQSNGGDQSTDKHGGGGHHHHGDGNGGDRHEGKHKK